MKHPKRIKVGCICFVLLAFSFSAFAQEQIEKIPQDVVAEVQAKGSARVMVELDVPWAADGNHKVQGAAIRAAVAQLKQQLQGTSYKVLAEYQLTPSVFLEIGPAALRVLAASPLVTGIGLEVIMQPHLNQSAP